MDIQLPGYAKVVANKLTKKGYKVYLVGGYLRDTLMGRKLGDCDLATDARPDVVSRLFSKTVEAGKQYGTIIIIIKNKNVEVTTLRKESGYKDSRHPDKVEFCDDIRLDLQRRDFTINAMAWDVSSGALLDPFGGRDDLKARIIRCVGNPLDRLREDTLRVFRAARFAAQLGFTIEKETEKAIEHLCMDSCLRRNDIDQPIPQLPAAERIRVELLKMLGGTNYTCGLSYLNNWGLLYTLLGIPPEQKLAAPVGFDVFQKLAWLLSGVNNKREILTKLTFSRKEIKTIIALSENNYDYATAELTVNNLALSGLQIKGLGFKDKKIGEIQRFLLKQVKMKIINNEKKLLLKEITRFSK